MDRERARQEIRAQISCTDFLTKSKSGLYCCPACGSGTKQHRDGALKYHADTNTWHCFSCKRTGDAIDLYQIKTGASYNEALNALAAQIGITIDPYRLTEAPQSGFNRNMNTNTPKETKTPQNAADEAQADYRSYYAECAKRITDPAALAYLEKRGISQATAEAYQIGYDPKADPAQSGHPCPRIIIPTSPGHYIARRIDGQKEFAKMNPKGSTPAIFNGKALYEGAEEIFIAEGAFDALSILETGHAAIALNSTANADKLLKILEEKRTAATLILCLDNDEAGQKAADTLAEGLKRLNVSYITANIAGEYKDPNEALTADKESFLDAIEEAQHRTAAKPDNTAYYIDNLMNGDMERFKGEKKTGFANLDKKAGGLYSGLYILAAISSLGKTSFALQMADQLAEAGNEVIFFSLEQSRLELVSKSIARRTVKRDYAGLDFGQAVDSLKIRKGKLTDQVLKAAEEYKKAVGDRISIIEGNYTCDIPFIREYVKRYIERTGARPIVIIDYLQILQPETVRGTKENIDHSITELKRISRDLDITLLVISSVNRANYLTPIDYEALKESGSIEYTADVIYGLQLQCLNEDLFSQKEKLKEKRARVKAAKAENPRKIELICLKNRYGIANFTCYFDYYPANDLFTEGKPGEANPWANAATV